MRNGVQRGSKHENINVCAKEKMHRRGKRLCSGGSSPLPAKKGRKEKRALLIRDRER